MFIQVCITIVGIFLGIADTTSHSETQNERQLVCVGTKDARGLPKPRRGELKYILKIKLERRSSKLGEEEVCFIKPFVCFQMEDASVLRSLPPGRIGTLQIRKSGRAVLVLGDVHLNVQSGTQSAFKQVWTIE